MSTIQRLMAILIPCGLLASAPALAARPAASPAAGPAAVEQPQVDVMVKTPYLIYPGVVGQMEVLWQLAGSYTSTIDWGTDLTYASGSASSVEYGTGNQHAYTITGLLPATRYYYRVTTFGVPYTGSFLSAPADDATGFKFLIYGDTRSNPAQHDLEAAALLSTINSDPGYQTLTLFMGDYVLNGCTESYWTSEWFSPLYPNIRTLTAKLPYAGCMGNHETYPAGQTTLFPKYYPYPFAGSRYYYSFDYGPAHFTVLDAYTAYDSNSVQGQWFRNDLAASTRTWKFVVVHEPGWSASNTCGTGHPNNLTVQTQVEPFCERYGVAAVFSGHNHYYARAMVNGIAQITAGGGGAPLSTGCLGQPNEVAYLADYHFCKIAIDGGVLQYQAINRDTRAVIDSFTLVRALPDVTPPSVVVTAPVGGERWDQGSVQTITWTASDDVGVDSIDVDCSLTGAGGPWLAVAHGLSNSGAYAWTLPMQPSDSALVRVTARDAAHNARSATSDSLFHVVDPTASVDIGGPVALALARPQPNPSHGTTMLAFSLPQAGSARLEIVDLGGRRVWSLDGVFPAGTQRWLWDGATTSGERAGAGLYFVRLSTPWGERLTRLVRLR